jgi:hypothetical protein
MDVVIAAAMADNGVKGPLQEALGDEAVETADDDAEPKTSGVQFPLNEPWHGCLLTGW